MMLVNAKQSSLRLLVKQLHPLDRRKCLPQIGDVWTPTRIRGLTTRNVHCNISSLLHSSFVTTTTAISNNNCSTSKQFLRCYSYSASSATSLLDAGGRKTVNEAYATTAADDEEVDISSLASRVDRLEKRTKDILSNIQKIQQQNGRQQRDASSPTLSPALRSHICSVIRSWGSLLWGKSNAHNYRTKFIAESYIQRGVLASHQLLDAIVQEDLRICRSGGRTLLLLDSQVDKNILALCCNVVINGWARSGFYDAGWRAKSILEFMEELHEKGNKFYKPLLYTYNGVLNAFIKTMLSERKTFIHNKRYKKKDAITISSIPDEVERILDRMEKLSSTGHNPDALPNNISYNMLITAISRSRDPKAGEKSEAILNRMQQLYERTPSRVDVRPDQFTYASVLDAWYKVASMDSTNEELDFAANRAMAILKRMNVLRKEVDIGMENNAVVKPNTVAVSTVICALTATALKAQRNNNNDAAQKNAQRARALLEWQIQSYLDGNTDMKPQLVIFNRVMDAIAKTSGPLAAEELLSRLEHLHQTCTGIEGPDVYSYTTIVSAWSRRKDRFAADRADAILQRMETLYLTGVMKAKPNNFTYNAVIIAYSRNKQGVVSAEKAEKLLQRMELLASSATKGDKKPINTRDDLRPDKITFSSVMAAWMNSNAPASLSLNRVEALHQKMEDLYHAGNEQCKPDLVSLSTLIGALAKSEVDDAPQRAEAIFQRMREWGIRPNLYTYNSLIHAWVNSKQPDAMQRAEAIFEDMVNLSSGENGDHDAKPDNVTFATLLDGFSKRYTQKEMVDRAEAMLEQLISRYRSGASDVKPTCYVFNSVVTIYARLGRVDDAVRILHRMKTLHSDGTLPDVAPTIVTYNAIIVGCSAVSTEDETERRRIILLASFLLNEVENSNTVHADSYTYGELFTVCRNMITDEEERSKSFLDLFQRCCRDGQMNNFVISRFLAADVSGAALFKKLFGPYIDEKDFVDISKLPADWCRNAQLFSRYVGTKKASPNEEKN